MKKILISIALCILLLGTFVQVSALENESTNLNTNVQIEEEMTSSVLSVSEKEKLNAISPELAENEVIIKLKEADVLTNFINEIEIAYATEKSDSLKYGQQQLQEWGISLNDEVKDIYLLARECLDSYYDGLDITSKVFHDFAFENYNNGFLELYSKANENIYFASLYVYISIYCQNVNEDVYDDTMTLKLSSYDINSLDEVLINEDFLKMSMEDVLIDDFTSDFINKDVNIKLKEYEVSISKASYDYFPQLDGLAIEYYAETFGKDPNTSSCHYIENGNCTNFVSQALFFGGLPTQKISSDSSQNGYVDTTDRWFYYINDSESGFSCSTSWVRVEDLYDYLAPYYGTLATYSEDTISNYLNIGFVLQGRKFLNLNYSHSVIIVENDEDVYELLYAANTNNTSDEDLSVFYDSFYRYRVIQTY